MFEPRPCVLRNWRLPTVFGPRQPLQPGGYRYENVCVTCQESSLVNRPRTYQSRAPTLDQLIPTDEETRNMIEEEIRLLCDALVAAIFTASRDSSMRTQLIHHMHNTRVEAWKGFTVCRFLKEVLLSNCV